MSNTLKHQLKVIDFSVPIPSGFLFIGSNTEKSKMVIELIKYRKHLKTLVLSSKLIASSWGSRFNTQFDDIDSCQVTVLSTGSIKKRLKIAKETISLPSRQTLVINYETVYNDDFKDWLLLAGFDFIVCDDISKIKTAGSKISQYLSKLGKCIPYRLGLFNPSILQLIIDIYSEFKFLDPSIFKYTYAEFKNQYAIVGGFNNYEIIEYKNKEDFYEKFYSITFQAKKD